VAAVQRRIAERHYFESRPGASCLDAETFLCRATSSLLESSLVTTRSGPGDRPRDLTVIMKQYVVNSAATPAPAAPRSRSPEIYFLARKVVEEACFSRASGNSITTCPNGQEKQFGPGSGTRPRRGRA
jgi:hypothetical protein